MGAITFLLIVSWSCEFMYY